jgi:hypothetical protein
MPAINQLCRPGDQSLQRLNQRPKPGLFLFGTSGTSNLPTRLKSLYRQDGQLRSKFSLDADLRSTTL